MAGKCRGNERDIEKQMNRIIIDRAVVEGDTIRYKVSEMGELNLLQKDNVELFVRYQGSEGIDWGLNQVPQSILLISISLYLIPLTWFYDVELVIPEMDEDLYNHLPSIYNAYSKIYGPFDPSWRGMISIGKVVRNVPVEQHNYDKVVFFSGGVDACHAGINNPGEKTLLVSIPDIEWQAKNDGLLRDEKFSLIRNFSEIVHSDWLVISNNFNTTLHNFPKIQSYLQSILNLNSLAFQYDGLGGIRYLPNMCCCAPVVYHFGIHKMVLGSSFEQIENNMNINYDGTNPELSDAIGFAGAVFSEHDGLTTRRTAKVKDIIEWCNRRHVKTKLWVCFNDNSAQCGRCNKCVRTQLNILCAGENPKDWGFDNFSEKKFSKFVKSYHYVEVNPCWLWDITDTIDTEKQYPYCNGLLHWLKEIGYINYQSKAIPPQRTGCSFGECAVFANILITLNRLLKQ